MKEDSILKYALQNAVKFNGRANPGAVMGKILQEQPSLKKKIKSLAKKINEIVKEVDSLSLVEQKTQLAKFKFRTVKKKRKDIFSILKLKQGILTAFPPGPEKYPHLGHAKALILNYEVALRHKGKFILRFEDTNPNLVKKEYYDIMLQDFAWLGIKWDKLQYASDNMSLFYKYAQSLLKSGKAYVCYCSQDDIKTNRFKGLECNCRNQNVSWSKFLKEKKGILRLKIKLKHPNTTMRDPTIFRFVSKSHPRQGKKYSLWPNYDFQNAIMDGHYKVDFRIRSKEFELRKELQSHIQELLNLHPTRTYEIGRLNLEGTESSGRIIREKISNKELSGWDDPRLTTLAALRKRGFLPQAIYNFALTTGISKAESTLTWDELTTQNKKILDPISNRYFFVENPKKIKIKNTPNINAKAPLHPDFPKKGFRNIKTSNEFYIKDALEKDKIYRFMHLFNFKNKEFISSELDPRLSAKMIHWLPVAKDLIKTEIIMPDSKIKKGLAEPLIQKLKVNDIIQFERLGFCRLDKKTSSKLIFYYTHK
ncbi:MAG: glutamate--tRNA ligase [Nanoarchaeota archaeon]|nr:glutamate--tRNA ligase [Nanoarchaeota archaeon]|tara:strand:- start:24191 stop:25801 length:1611 start_codon:yes stop_codon:yes gene_type:complete